MCDCATLIHFHFGFMASSIVEGRLRSVGSCNLFERDGKKSVGVAKPPQLMQGVGRVPSFMLTSGTKGMCTISGWLYL